jgi:WD40 repeat protein
VSSPTLESNGASSANLGVQDAERLRLLLADQIESEAFELARQTARALLALDPDDADAREAQALLSQAVGPPTPASDEIRRFLGHRAWVNSVAFSPDGTRIISGGGGALVDGEFHSGADCTIRLWNTANGEEIACCRGHSTVVNAVAFANNGEWFVSASRRGSMCVWDGLTGRGLKVFPHLKGAIWSVACDPRGGRIVSGNDDHFLRLWDSHTRERLVRYDGHRRGVSSVAFSSTGQEIASGSFDNTVRLWDASTGAPRLCLKGHTQSVMSVAFSPDNRLIASAACDGTIRLWHVGSNKEIHRFEVPMCPVNSVTFSPDGSRIVSGHSDNLIRVWDLGQDRETSRYAGHADAVTSVACSPDGATILSGSRDGTVRLWTMLNHGPSPHGG